MKKQDILRKLIREEVKRVLKEAPEQAPQAAPAPADQEPAQSMYQLTQRGKLFFNGMKKWVATVDFDPNGSFSDVEMQEYFTKPGLAASVLRILSRVGYIAKSSAEVDSEEIQ